MKLNKAFFSLVFLCNGTAYGIDLMLDPVSKYAVLDPLLKTFFHDQERMLVAVCGVPIDHSLFDLYYRMRGWLSFHVLLYPINIECSFKITPHAIHRRRYVVQLPLACLKHDDQLLNELLRTCRVPEFIITVVTNKSGARGYSVILALDADAYARGKVYIDYGWHTGIWSVEWQLNDTDIVAERTYTNVTIDFVDHYCLGVLPAKKLRCYRQLRSFLDVDRLLFKRGGSTTRVELPFVRNTLVGHVSTIIESLSERHAHNQLHELLVQGAELYAHWIGFAANEINVYMRLFDWYVVV